MSPSRIHWADGATRALKHCSQRQRWSVQPKAVGIGVSRRFRDGFQRQQIQRLHGAVFHRGNSQRPLFSVGLRDINPPQGLRSISSTLQRSDGLDLAAGSCQTCPVDPRRVLTLIFRHSFHGQGFAAKRVGQQPLQGFHFAPAAFPCCLYDTCLQPPDVALALSPVNLSQ